MNYNLILYTGYLEFNSILPNRISKHTPITVITNPDRVLNIENPLIYGNNEYKIDFKDLKEKLTNPEVTLMMLCNPHNPVSKIWSREDLEKRANLCAKYSSILNVYTIFESNNLILQNEF